MQQGTWIGKEGESVEEISLDTILRRLDIEHVDAIKMDCEGCEYDLDLDRFAEVQFMGEVHLPDHGARWGRETALQKHAGEMWQFLCSHGRFAMHGCKRLETHVYG